MNNQESIKFISRGDMKRLIQSGQDLSEYAIISISDTSYEYEEMLGLLDGLNFAASAFQDTDDEDGMSPLQAKQILHYINNNANKKFIVHCYMGISRSGAIAKFINEYLDRGIWYLEDYSGYNRRVFNQLMAAAGMSLASYYEELEKQDRMMI